MCYGYGLREDELNEASPAFVSLFLQGQTEREFERVKSGLIEARFIASAMSKEAATVKFSWERESRPKPNIPDDVWDKFTLELNGVKATEKDLKKFVN
jgi:hypothetical protein